MMGGLAKLALLDRRDWYALIFAAGVTAVLGRGWGAGAPARAIGSTSQCRTS